MYIFFLQSSYVSNEFIQNLIQAMKAIIGKKKKRQQSGRFYLEFSSISSQLKAQKLFTRRIFTTMLGVQLI